MYAEQILKRVVLVCVLAGLSLSLSRAQAPSPAQVEFNRGVTWLHSFMYEDAIDAFRAAQKIDPNYVMAYWG